MKHLLSDRFIEYTGQENLEPDKFIYYDSLKHDNMYIHVFDLKNNTIVKALVRVYDVKISEDIYFKRIDENIILENYNNYVTTLKILICKSYVLPKFIFDKLSIYELKVYCSLNCLNIEYILKNQTAARYVNNFVYSNYFLVGPNKTDENINKLILLSGTCECFMPLYKMLENPTQEQTDKYNLLSI
jgi:hypothetical protein